MKEICPKDMCTGCAACVNACPRSCIEMHEDKWGFINPIIDATRCVDCGLCEIICPSNNEAIEFSIPQKCYAAWSLDSHDRDTSTSGGIASVLSTFVISEGGVVYGAVVCKGAEIQHIRVESINDLYRLKGSKYVQSHITDVFKSVLADLKSGLKVLFTGTPCQVAGLKSFLKKPYPGLITVDIICHGVPNRKLLHEHLANKKIHIKDIDSLSFRGNKEYQLSVVCGGRKVYEKGMLKDSYLTGFMYGLFFRPSCYQCKYANEKRFSDLTIGDFWGLGEKIAFIHTKEKVSAILVNSQKGENLLNGCSGMLYTEERPVREAIEGNTQLQHPARKHEFYNLFRYLYPSIGYKYSVRICLMKFYVKNFFYRMLMLSPSFRKWYNKR